MKEVLKVVFLVRGALTGRFRHVAKRRRSNASTPTDRLSADPRCGSAVPLKELELEALLCLSFTALSPSLRGITLQT
jgi:hypothetical protein